MLIWLAPILVFVTVVFVHELGHFLAAKALGVYAPRFSIGFGPALWRRKIGETEYLLSALPLGGYVQLASKNDEIPGIVEPTTNEAIGTLETGGDANKPKSWDKDALVPFGPNPVPADRWLESKPLWGRVVILLAGVTMNMLLALGAGTFGLVHYGRPQLSTKLFAITADKPAAKGGLLVGDSVVKMNGKVITTWDEAFEVISTHPGKPIDVGVIRNGAEREFRVTPLDETAVDVATGKTTHVGRIGVGPMRETTPLPVTLAQAFPEVWHGTWGMAGSIFNVLGGLFTARVSAKELGGPMMIASVSVDAARNGGQTLLFLISLISVNLAVFNLLPLPILDGGQIVLTVIESIRGKAFGVKTRTWILHAGLAMVLLLLALTTYNDIHRFISGVVK